MGTFAVAVNDVTLNVGHGDNSKTIFENLSFSVARGEILSLIGASGSGKTSLLNFLSGYLKPSAGTLEYDPANTQVGVVLQDSNLFPWLNVRQNIEFGFRFNSNENKNQDNSAFVEELLTRLGLKELENKSVDTLSGGQAQRVSIARTLAIQPSLLLLDEPFSAVDALTRHELQDWVKALRDDFDLTIVLVTHDLEEAFYLADRVGLIDQGEKSIQFFDSEVVERKKTLDSELHNQIFKTLVRK